MPDHDPLEHLPEDWTRGLAVVAHPDDMEYGAASAVARWTSQGKEISYLLATRGEAGISSMSPEVVGPARELEQRESCAVVGVTVVEFLDHADGLVVPDLGLRRDLTAAIRRHRPEVVVTINHRDDWGGPSWNHPDHRAVGRALLDSVRDAANPWVFVGEGGAPWSGVRFAAINASPRATHAVEVTDTIEQGVASLLCHRVYLENLDGDMADAGAFIRDGARREGARLGVEMATSFEVIPF